jgi:hypothetical protein
MMMTTMTTMTATTTAIAMAITYKQRIIIFMLSERNGRHEKHFSVEGLCCVVERRAAE